MVILDFSAYVLIIFAAQSQRYPECLFPSSPPRQYNEIRYDTFIKWELRMKVYIFCKCLVPCPNDKQDFQHLIKHYPLDHRW